MSNLYWSVYKQLEKEVIDLSFSIYFDDKQFEFISTKEYNKTPPYSLRAGDLIVRCCNDNTAYAM